MTYLGFGSNLVAFAFALAVTAVLLAVIGIFAKDRRFVTGSRNAMLACGVTGAGAAAALVAGFLRGAYDIRYIFNYSQRSLSNTKKFAGLWAGLDGSILFWAALLGLIGGIVALTFLKKNVDPARRRLEPFVYAVYASVQSFFLGVITFAANPFDPMSPDMIASLTRAGLAPGGMPADGAGLNPILDTTWMMIHPPSVYLGFILYTVPFAYGAAALMAGEFSTSWIKATRGWTMVAWMFNTNGVVLGGLWAYEVLGWGGYWAWDPVENASFLPWLASTAFLHSVMVQERRGMLLAWNALLVCITFILSIFGTYLTRSGVVNSVHAFGSEGSVGVCFLAFLVTLIAFTLFLLFFRLPQLTNKNTIDTLFCRESVFILNNFVLLGLAVAISLLVLWPKMTFEFFGEAITVGVPVFNKVCIPLFVLLFALTAIGPALGWVRTTAKQAITNLLGPAVVSVPLALATQWFAWTQVRGGEQGEVFDGSLHLYPGAIMIFLCWLIVTSLAWEVLRTAVRAGAASGRGFGGALGRMLVMQNRRYGGYLVHCGLAMLGIAVTVSSIYRVQTEVSLKKGERVAFSADRRYELELRGMVLAPATQGQAFNSARAVVAIFKDGTEVATLDPEARYWPRNDFKPGEAPSQTTEVELARLATQDIYVYFERPNLNLAEGPFPGATWFETHTYRFSIFRNPFMWFLWSGWLTMIAGAAYAALPLGGRRVGLAD